MDNELEFDIEDQLLGIDDEMDSDDELEGLGRRFSFRPSRQVKRFARSFAARRVRRAVAARNLTRPQRIFAMKARELPKQTLQDLKAGGAHIIDGARYISKQISAASGVDELLRNSPAESVGVTNFDEGRMPAGANMLVSAVILELGNAAGVNVDAVEYSNIFDAAGLPSSFQNGEIEIQAGGKVILPSTPMARFFSVGGAAMVNADGAKEVKLAAPKMIKGGTKVEIIIRKPDNGALFAANNTFIKATLLGPETTNK